MFATVPDKPKKIREGTKESLVILVVAILLVGIFGLVCLISIQNSLYKDTTCLVCVDGRPPTFTMGNVTTLPCHNLSTVTNSGNSSDVILNFGIPGKCLGPTGNNASTTLIVIDNSLSTYIYSSNTTFPDRTIYVNISNNATFVLPPGVVGPPGIVGPPGPQGFQGIQGIPGPQGDPGVVPIIVRYTQPTLTTIPIPIGVSAVFYTIVGGGGGGGGGHGNGCGFDCFNGGGSSGGGGGSGRRISGFELLIGVSSITIQVGGGGQGGLSVDALPAVPTPGNYGIPSSIIINPTTSASVNGGAGGDPGIFDWGGNGGDGGYGGGGGGSSGQNTGSLPGEDLDLDGMITGDPGTGTLWYPGFDGNGGRGGGPHAGNGGRGRKTTNPFDMRLFTGGGGGGGGITAGSGGDGGSLYDYYSTLDASSCSGHDGTLGGGGGGAASSHKAGTVYNGVYISLIQGYNGGTGGDGYVEYMFV